MSNCFYYVLVVSPIAQTGRLLDFLVGLLTGSSWARYRSLVQPLRIFHAGIFRARVLPLGHFDFEPIGLPHSPAVSFAGQLFEWVSAFPVGIDAFVPVWLDLNMFLTLTALGL